jgi:hypothetical protein
MYAEHLTQVFLFSLFLGTSYASHSLMFSQHSSFITGTVFPHFIALFLPWLANERRQGPIRLL